MHRTIAVEMQFAANGHPDGFVVVQPIAQTTDDKQVRQRSPAAEGQRGGARVIDPFRGASM
jgi:hypothetical protein